MFDRLQRVALRYDELGDALATNEIAADPDKSIKLLRERAAIESVALAYQRWQGLSKEIADTEALAAAEIDA